MSRHDNQQIHQCQYNQIYPTMATTGAIIVQYLKVFWNILRKRSGNTEIFTT